MVFDPIINDSLAKTSKDFGKKKRTNRSAKLKQCKLDARREQWLSQVKNKGSKQAVKGGGGEFNGPTGETQVARYKDLEVRSSNVEETHPNSDSESFSANSPTSTLSGGNELGNPYTTTSSSSSNFSFSSGGSCSGNMTEEEESGGGDDNDDDHNNDHDNDNDNDDDDCLDDWETMADALEAADEPSHDKDTEFGMASNDVNTQARRSKSESDGILGKGGVNSKAWGPDDAFRPQNLPNLSKQQSCPANTDMICSNVVNPWVRPDLPTSCPICCEDLDLTDSSFLPCSCGFRLCLFCHKRILEHDGRCPGCRKPYSKEQAEKETSVSGGSLTVRLVRSCSMFSRV